MEEKILEAHGFKHIQTYDIKTPINGKDYFKKVIQFHGSWDDLYRVYNLFEVYGLEVSEARRVLTKQDIYKDNDSVNGVEMGQAFFYPVNEIVIF